MNTKTLRIVVVYEPIPPYLGEPNMQTGINARLDEAQGILQNAMEAVGVTPAEIHPALVVGRLAGLRLGSTSQKVVSHAPCPVLIVR
jgi:hypothetical protein